MILWQAYNIISKSQTLFFENQSLKDTWHKGHLSLKKPRQRVVSESWFLDYWNEAEVLLTIK